MCTKIYMQYYVSLVIQNFNDISINKHGEFNSNVT